MNVENVLNADDETVLTKAEDAECIALNEILPSRKYVDDRKSTSENDARTQATDVEEPIVEDDMKNLQSEDNKIPKRNAKRVRRSAKPQTDD